MANIIFITKKGLEERNRGVVDLHPNRKDNLKFYQDRNYIINIEAKKTSNKIENMADVSLVTTEKGSLKKSMVIVEFDKTIDERKLEFSVKDGFVNILATEEDKWGDMITMFDEKIGVEDFEKMLRYLYEIR